MKFTSTLALTFILCALISMSVPLVTAVEDSWVTLESMPTARHAFGVAVVDGKIYAMGGYVNSRFSNLNEMYDPKTDTWITRTQMPKPRSDFGIAVYQDRIFIVGGFGYIYGGVPGFVEATDVYDPETDTWDTRASIPTPREDLCANVVDNKIYLIGGNVYVGAAWPSLCNKNEVYDPETDTWDTKTPLPNYRGLASAYLDSALVDDKIYVISQTELDSTVPFNQLYDPETDTWSSGTMMPTLVSFFSAVATSGEFAPKRIHVLSRNTHQIYDPETDVWTNGTPMLTPRSCVGVAVVNDELYAIGGYNGGNDLAVNEKYTPTEYIPEFPLWLVLPLFLVVSLVAVCYRRGFCARLKRF